ncbi:nitrate- and nitrite sensing domain-containing protein [Micromonospora sp. NPDC049559]|uniref:sensor histidine kinase n=1 Tax=Micromonospora sp. NPDC049559 TaxID=3155923 RepID=UPI0034276672
MLLGRLRIRGKLAVLIIIPLLSTAALAVPVVAERIDAASRADRTAAAVRTAGLVGTVVQEMQEERLLSVGYLLGVADRPALVRQTATVTDRIGDLRAELGAALPTPVAEALDGVQALTDVRAGVLARKATPDQVMAAFEPVVGALLDSPRLLDSADTATRAGRQLVALDAVLHTDEQISVSGTLIVLVVATRSQPASMRFIASMAQLRVVLDRFSAFATDEQNALYTLVNEAVIARTNKNFLEVGEVNPAAAVAGLSVASLFPAVSSLGTLGQFVEKKVISDILRDVTEQQRRALGTAYTVGALVLLVLLVVVALSVAVARTVARPLTRLTGSADRVARLTEAELVRVADDETESPNPIRLDPVDVAARDEIGDLARAFDRVQSTAGRLVERQAASRRNVAQMFGHVGRRTQNLVGRQIALIDRLEQRETDPSRLQHLYRLDHVSSRLRRNASSLVVLSGSAGSDGHVAPLPLGDVVRLALGEIEDYTRVDVQVQTDVSVVPAVIGDLVLALAELMENGTSFSPPHTRVTVSSRSVPEGVRVLLVDHGIGMSPERLAEENARLTRRERLDLAPTELLGLFVVGRLARRHGWRVALSATPGGGVTAHLELDSRLLVSTPAGPPAAARTAPAPLPVEPVGPGEPKGGGRAPTGLTPDEVAVDPKLLNRAKRSVASGPQWNAFAPQPGPAGPSGPGGGSAAPAGPAGPSGPGGGSAALSGTAGNVRPIRQRVPGAQLPLTAQPGPGAPGADPGTGPGADVAPGPGDPDAVRALVEAFESGVRRAAGGPVAPTSPAAPTPDAPVPAPPAPPPAPAPSVLAPPVPTAPAPTGTTSAPAGTLATSTGAPSNPTGRAAVRTGTPPASLGIAVAPAGSARPPLTRRVPGANLSVPAAAPPPDRTGQRPEDPDEVRRQITQFEAGIERALREASPNHGHEEGSPR